MQQIFAISYKSNEASEDYKMRIFKTKTEKWTTKKKKNVFQYIFPILKKNM